MFDLGDEDSSTSFSDILDSFVNAGQKAYSDYELSSAGIIPTSNPGQYVIQPGSRGQIVQPTSSNQMTIIVVIILLIVGIFAFKVID